MAAEPRPPWPLGADPPAFRSASAACESRPWDNSERHTEQSDFSPSTLVPASWPPQPSAGGLPVAMTTAPEEPVVPVRCGCDADAVEARRRWSIGRLRLPDGCLASRATLIGQTAGRVTRVGTALQGPCLSGEPYRAPSSAPDSLRSCALDRLGYRARPNGENRSFRRCR